MTRGQGVAYVTDAADHVANRAKIVRLAAGADHLFIETPSSTAIGHWLRRPGI